VKPRALCLLLTIICFSSEASAQLRLSLPSQEIIAADLRSADIEALVVATSHATRIPIEEWSPTLRSAILYALEHEIRRDTEARRAKQPRWLDEPLSLRLIELAIDMQDPAAIPSLVLMADHARNALVAFGRQALPHLLSIAKGGKNLELFVVRGSLTTMYEMVQEWGIKHFTAEEQAQLKEVAALYLVPDTQEDRVDWDYGDRGAILRKAAILALVLEDTEARAWVERLVADPEAFPDKEAAKYALEIERWFYNLPPIPNTPLDDFIEAFEKRQQ